MRASTASTFRSEDAARAHLASQFPTVPSRVIDSVWSAYREATPTLVAALAAAHARIEDARATSLV
jgi:hypothetical protein